MFVKGESEEELEELINKEEKNILTVTMTKFIPHFKEKVTDHLRIIFNFINGTKKQKGLIWSKSLEILNDFIFRVEQKEFIVPINANLQLIASTIIYTAIISNENMPNITISEIVKILGINSGNMSAYYNKYFRDLYPRTNFLFSIRNFSKIRQIVSLYFFTKIKNNVFDISDLVLQFKENIIKNIHLPRHLLQKDRISLREVATVYPDIFDKYFLDLVEVVKQLAISGRIHKKIGAILIIKYVAAFLEERNINLFQTSQVFYRSVRDIFDYLKEKMPDLFPIRSHTQEKVSKKERYKRNDEYKKIVGSKLKLYVIKNIYNGRYYKNGKGKCPECLKEGLQINTDITRLKALEFHHKSAEFLEEKSLFSASRLYVMFTKGRSNPFFLEDLIKSIESENVILICRNHHIILHDDYYKYFKYLISWDELFSLTAEMIYLLVMNAVNNFRLTKNLPKAKKKKIRFNIIKKIKKRYIIECVYGEYCPSCEEISTKRHLPAFHFHHLHKNSKLIEPNKLYESYSCTEIVNILEREMGGYICSNCHSIIQYNNLHLSDKIYEDKFEAKKYNIDYNRVRDKFKVIHNKKLLIKDSLKKSIRITTLFEKYLIAIYEISLLNHNATTPDLMDYLKVGSANVHGFFKRNKVFMKNYVNIIAGNSNTPTKYIMTNKGREIISVILHFKDYYYNLDF